MFRWTGARAPAWLQWASALIVLALIVVVLVRHGAEREALVAAAHDGWMAYCAPQRGEDACEALLEQNEGDCIHISIREGTGGRYSKKTPMRLDQPRFDRCVELGREAWRREQAAKKEAERRKQER